MHLIEVDLSHQGLLTDKFRQIKLDMSEYSFANTYLFRHIHHYQIFYKQELFLKGIARDGSSFLMPTFPLFEASESQLKGWLEEADFFFPIPEEWKNRFDPNMIDSSFSESESDYLFALDKIRCYDKKLKTKQNQVDQFLSSHTVQAYPLTAERVEDAQLVLSLWKKSNEDIEADYGPCQEALHLLAALQLTGEIFYVDGKPAAFLIGEYLHSSFVIHFTKALKSIKGLYQYVYEEFAQHIDETCPFINMEQDLGSPQIRQSKRSYHPDLMLHKWRIQLKGLP